MYWESQDEEEGSVNEQDEDEQPSSPPQEQLLVCQEQLRRYRYQEMSIQGTGKEATHNTRVCVCSLFYLLNI